MDAPPILLHLRKLLPALMHKRVSLFCLLSLLLGLTGAVHAATPEQILVIALGENEQKIVAINAIAASGGDSALALLQALADGQMQTAEGGKVLILSNGVTTDAISGSSVASLPANLEEVTVNNRIRRALDAAIATLKLASNNLETRLAAVSALEKNAEEDMLPLIGAALARETNTDLKNRLVLVQAALQLKSQEPAIRLKALQALADSSSPAVQALLLGLLEKNGNDYAEPDADIRALAERTLKKVEFRLTLGERVGQLFTGLSLGSILLLAALGLAITYGLMGVINMAHGELIMVGAYATYLVQNAFRAYAPGWFDWYLLPAAPLAFLGAALVGAVLERTVIRFLYGRPLETLLATWGISLILVQSVRTIFGAQNVPVENPAWMSGGVQLLSNVVLPYNRIAIIAFAALVLVAIWLMLTRTRLGLFVRSVTQNRAMASCMGVPTARVDTLAFALGSGVAGLAGCALSQVGNVGPDLGQNYIVDSFMVVVLGGVGQLAGTVYAALGLGIANKFLESWSGAVLAKIIVLAFIVIFIQKRPQGLFALKGRSAES